MLSLALIFGNFIFVTITCIVFEILLFVDAVIVVLPSFLAKITPSFVTVATLEFELFQFIVLSLALLGVTVAIIFSLSPCTNLIIVLFNFISVISAPSEDTSSETTTSIFCSIPPFDDFALIVAVPVFRAFIKPPSLIVTIFEFVV